MRKGTFVGNSWDVTGSWKGGGGVEKLCNIRQSVRFSKDSFMLAYIRLHLQLCPMLSKTFVGCSNRPADRSALCQEITGSPCLI